jgi:hypothetical protein
MENDIQRELWFAQTPHGAGNVLAALGLVVYTEALGRIRTRNAGTSRAGMRGQERTNFNECFDLMGASYRPWRARFEKREGRPLYSALRNGLAHEYAPKVPFKVVMFGTPRVAIVRQRGRYVFVVGAYLRDFRTAARRIYADLMALRSPTIPPPD